MPFPAAQYFNLTRQGTNFQEIHGIFQMLVHNWDQSSLLQDTETLLPSKQIPFPPFFFFLCFVGVFVCLFVFSSWQTCESWKGNRNKTEREVFLSAVFFRCNDYGYNQHWLFTVQYFLPQLGSTLTCSYTYKHCWCVTGKPCGVSNFPSQMCLQHSPNTKKVRYTMTLKTFLLHYYSFNECSE